SDMRQMLATQSVENIQFLPFLATDANNLGWLGYGCLKRDPTLVAVNAVGAALNTLCVLVYLRYSPHKRRVLLRSLALLVPLAAGYGYAALAAGARLARLGLFCSAVTVAMYVSPLADLVRGDGHGAGAAAAGGTAAGAAVTPVQARVLRSRSTRCLSFPLTVTTFLASASWTLYGAQLRDPYIAVPNVPGIVTSVLRFWLFWRYPPGQDKPPRALPT
ncbi:SWET1 protein, partial [Nothoprocta ornata]|nr:SWET1 protein [Nothoprocta ornata]